MLGYFKTELPLNNLQAMLLLQSLISSYYKSYFKYYYINYYCYYKVSRLYKPAVLFKIFYDQVLTEKTSKNLKLLKKHMFVLSSTFSILLSLTW